MQHEGGALGITHWIAFPFVSYAAMDVTKFRSGGIGFGRRRARNGALCL
jgi:hypothetical protein